MSDTSPTPNISGELLQLAGLVGELKGMLSAMQSNMQNGATRMDGFENRIRYLEISVARYAAIGAVSATIVSIIAQQIVSRLF